MAKLKIKENHNIEFKKSWRDEYLKWICGFANADGDTIYIGVDDNGTIVGINNAEKLLEEIPNKVISSLGIMVSVNLLDEEGNQYIEIIVESYPTAVNYKGQYHYRSGSTKQELKGSALNKFLLKKQGIHWDKITIPEVKNEELHELEYFRKQVRRSKRLSEESLKEDDLSLLEKLRLKVNNEFTRSAILLFGKDPEKYITGAYIKIGYFETDSNIRFQNEVHGDLFNQVNQTLDLILTKYFIAEISYEGIHRVETYPVPEEALREALLNAIAHKDYSSAVPIQIRVYKDKIMIWNNGELPSGWTVENLFNNHSSHPYNPDIANAFFYAGMVESWGRGIDSMISSCKAHGTPKPEIHNEMGGLWLTFNFTQKTSGKTSGITSGKILELISSNARITIPEMAAIINITERSIERNIRKLQKEGQLKRVGSAKGGYWEVEGDI